jgi:archaellum component FlaG (FlaF/FlaG flagellin family)
MVTPAPDIAVEWLEEVGFPQIIDFNRVGDIWIEAAYIVTVTVRNVGVETLYVAEINSDEEHFGADPVEFELEPGEEMVVEVIFQAEEEGLYEGTLTIISNDPDEEETIIQLRAEAFEPPEMLVNADSLSLEIEGNEAQAVLEISNTGQYELNWDATLVQVEGNLLDSTEAIFSVEPQSGAISPGAMQEVLIKAIFAIEGNFDLAFDLVINSNDPDLPEMVVDVRISGTNEVEELPAWALPESPILASIQPNPFNSSAILEFYLPSRSAATLKLFDLQGRERGVIFNGVLEAGFHQATIETGNLPAAIYLVQIKAGEEIRVVRAVVVK